jgi:hypothetical protein
MKRILLLVIIATGVLFKVQAQITARAGFELSTYDRSANPFFDRYSNIDHISIEYKDGKARTLDIYFRNQKTTSTLGEQYILTFDGDLHLFKRKYRQFPLPNAAKLKMSYISGIKKLGDSNSLYSLTTTLRRDSIIQRFSFYTVTGDTEPDLDPGRNRPLLRGDILKLTKSLEQNFKQWKPVKVTDSIIIITGTVEKNGTIGKLQLVEGRKSTYSDKVLEFMSREATSWWPVMQGGKLMQWAVRISVRVNKDESIKVSIL